MPPDPRAGAGPGLLDRRIEAPRFLEEGGDLAAAAIALPFFEWRACLLWALAFGFPRAILMIALGAEHAAFAPASPFGDTVVGFALFALFEPLAAGSAFVFLESRAERRPVGFLAVCAQAAARFVPMLVLVVLVEALAFTSTAPVLPLGWLSPSGRVIGAAISTVLVAALRAALIIAGPHVVLGGLGPGSALKRSMDGARSAFPAWATACLIITVLHLTFEVLVQSPNVLAESPGCQAGENVTLLGAAFCSIWWRGLYLWLGQWLVAPFYVVAFLAYQERR